MIDDGFRGLVQGFPVWQQNEAPDHVPRGDPLSAALGWLADNAEFFDPPCWERHLPKRPFPSAPLLELLQLCHVLARRQDGVGREVTERAVRITQRVLERPSFAAGLYRADGMFTYHVWFLALAERLGVPVPPLRRAAQGLLDAGARPTASGVGALELRHAADLGGFAAAHLPDRAWLARHWLDGQHLDAFRLNDVECYGITHAAFYATGFGAAPCPVDLTVLNGPVELLAGAYLAAGNLDLGAELVATSLLAGGTTAFTRAAWRRIRGAQHEDGAVPGPLYRAADAARTTGDTTRAYRFGTCYHTTIAFALTAALFHETEVPETALGNVAGAAEAETPDITRFAVTALSSGAGWWSPPPRAGEAVRQASPPPGLPLPGNPAALREIAVRAGAADGTARQTWSAVVDQGIVIAVRRGDLDLLACFLVAAAELDLLAHSVPAAAVAYLAAQQQPDGGFGVPAADVDPLAHEPVRTRLTATCLDAFAAVLSAARRHVTE
ncbi:DUF6895 family protein [Actinokineospora iranica]|uniref:DUF6895 domain-containing protein n=1 Tax=Actinokineospora iranica TaxID=1271860 RepID=A0A1G6MEI9_9PSEU|nr:hypothetical protein [Actinokineospora iranica]SDC53697.1 hypothetical protein SAMN05216174_102503 [Actinokineospora iranica]